MISHEKPLWNEWIAKLNFSNQRYSRLLQTTKTLASAYLWQLSSIDQLGFTFQGIIDLIVNTLLPETLADRIYWFCFISLIKDLLIHKFLFSEKDCPGATVSNSNVTGEAGHVYGDSVTVQCDHGFVRDDGGNNATSYDITCGVDATWSDNNACIRKYVDTICLWYSLVINTSFKFQNKLKFLLAWVHHFYCGTKTFRNSRLLS